MKIKKFLFLFILPLILLICAVVCLIYVLIVNYYQKTPQRIINTTPSDYSKLETILIDLLKNNGNLDNLEGEKIIELSKNDNFDTLIVQILSDDKYYIEFQPKRIDDVKVFCAEIFLNRSQRDDFTRLKTFILKIKIDLLIKKPELKDEITKYKTLLPHKWVSDIIIAEFIKKLLKNNNECCFVDNTEIQSLINSFDRLKKGNKLIKQLKTTNNYILFLENKHYYLGYLDQKTNTIDIFDSKNSAHGISQVKRLAEILNIQVVNSQIDVKQTDSFSCGVFVCMEARKRILNKNYQPSLIDSYRLDILNEITNEDFFVKNIEDLKIK